METYHAGHRAWQERFDTRRLADRIDERLMRDRIDDDDHAFIERCDMLFLATVDGESRPQCSYKGGNPGLFIPWAPAGLWMWAASPARKTRPAR
jgi:predicted pyridoxine 5'-phosphate oxidase superfamily flavin-nucleotide-binding protein